MGTCLTKFAKLSPAHTQAFWCWLNMRIRCRYPSSKDYPRYGGRGIKVCQLWDDSFEAFVRDFGLPPSPGLTVDRRNNNLGYHKGNCRWATNVEQQRNKRNNKLITYSGVTKCAAEWAEILGGRTHLVTERLKLGWTVQKAVTTPARKHKRK